MTFYTILCLTNTKVIRKHAKEIIAELTIRTIEDWTLKNRMTVAKSSDPGCVEELTAAAREWVHLVSEIETLPKRYGTTILEPAHAGTEL